MDITSYLVSEDSPGHGPFGAPGRVSDGTVTLLQLCAPV